MKVIEAKKIMEEFIEEEDPKIILGEHAQALCTIVLELGNKFLFNESTKKEGEINKIE